MLDIDVSPLTEEAKPIVRKAATIYQRHMEPWFIGLLIRGSALKGGFIPKSSDVDFLLYLKDSALTLQGHLLLQVGFAIHREIAEIDLGPFRYIQCLTRSKARSKALTGPIPGAYHMVVGHLPVPEATIAQLRTEAEKALKGLDPTAAFSIDDLLGSGSTRLAPQIRLFCTRVWPMLYHVLALHHDNAIAVWGLSRKQAIQLLPRETALGQSIRRFHQAVQAYYPSEESMNSALDIVESGVSFLEAAKVWWSEINRNERAKNRVF
jgi:hypothetical protein